MGEEGELIIILCEVRQEEFVVKLLCNLDKYKYKHSLPSESYCL